MRSPRFAPAGLLVTHAGQRVMIDGGERGAPAGELDAWIVTDEGAELMPEIRRACAARGITPGIARVRLETFEIRPRAVRHTSHRAVGYEISDGTARIVWAPEFWRSPVGQPGATSCSPTRRAGRGRSFAGGVGGHAAVLEVAHLARIHGVGRYVIRPR